MSSDILHQNKSHRLRNMSEETRELLISQGICNNILDFPHESKIFIHNDLSLVRIIEL